jgi:hypothetical protein
MQGASAIFRISQSADSICHPAIPLWRSPRSTSPPLAIDIVDSFPNPGCGGPEPRELAERGKLKLVLGLALLHCLAISFNIQTAELFEWLDSQNRDLIIEFVTREDPTVRNLLCNNVDNHAGYRVTWFEDVLRRTFAAVLQREVGSPANRLDAFVVTNSGGAVELAMAAVTEE